MAGIVMVFFSTNNVVKAETYTDQLTGITGATETNDTIPSGMRFVIGPDDIIAIGAELLKSDYGLPNVYLKDNFNNILGTCSSPFLINATTYRCYFENPIELTRLETYKLVAWSDDEEYGLWIESSTQSKYPIINSNLYWTSNLSGFTTTIEVFTNLIIKAPEFVYVKFDDSVLDIINSIQQKDLFGLGSGLFLGGTLITLTALKRRGRK